MAQQNTRTHATDLDGLRLVALGRIPRCGACPRFHALLDAHSRESVGVRPLPGVPESCTHQVCAPLVARYESDDRERERVPAGRSVLHRQAC